MVVDRACDDIISEIILGGIARSQKRGGEGNGIFVYLVKEDGTVDDKEIVGRWHVSECFRVNKSIESG